MIDSTEFVYDVEDNMWTHDLSGWTISGASVYGLYNETIKAMFKKDTGLDISSEMLDTMRDVTERMQYKSDYDWSNDGRY